MPKPPRKIAARPRSATADAARQGRVPREVVAGQSSLALDPMPARVDPCLAKLASRPPEGPQWAYEVKWDGYRLALHTVWHPGADTRA